MHMMQQQPPPPPAPQLSAHDALSLPEALGPEHVEPVYRTLLAALNVSSSSSSDPQRQQQQPRGEAEALLRAFEAVPHYCDVLCSIVARYELP